MAKKFARILAIIVISIILVNILLYITFSIPPIQKWAADYALEKLEPVLGTNTNLDGIRIRLFNTVELNGLYVEDQQQDTLFYAGKINARIRALDLLRSRVTVQKAGVENFKAILYRETSEAPFNFQFIIDAFATEKDTTVVKKEKKPMRITAEELILKNGSLRYNILSEQETPGAFNSNHIDIVNLNFKANGHFQSVEDIYAEVDLLNFIEANSGLHLINLETEVKGKGKQLESDNLQLTLNKSNIEIDVASYNTESKEFSLKMISEQLDPKDIGVFYSPISDLSEMLSFEIIADGQLPTANLNKLSLQYGADTQFEITGMISDYSDFNNSDLKVDVSSLSVSQSDLESIIRVFANEYYSPTQLTALGDLNLNLQAVGKLNRFHYDSYIVTEQGNVTINGTGRITDKFKYLSFEGPVRVEDIQIANIIGDGAGLGNTTMSANAKVVIPRDSLLSVTAKGVIESLTYKDYFYNDINFNGIYLGNNVSANLNMDSPLNQFDINGDITFGDSLGFIVDGNVQRLNLSPFILMETWNTPLLTTQIEANMSGTTIDDMTGTLVIDNTSIVDSNFIYNPGPIYLQALADAGEGKKLQIMSEFMEAEIIGDYYFSSIAKEVKQVLRPHLPSLLSETSDNQLESTNENIFQDTELSNEEVELSGKNNFDFNIQLSNTEDLSYTFALPFYNVEQATINGSVNMKDNNSLQINGYIPRMMFGKNDIRETKIDFNNKQYGANVNVNTYLVQSNGFINAILKTEAANDSVINNLAFDIEKSNSSADGKLLVSMGFSRDRDNELASNIRIHPTTIDFNGNNIDINDASILYNKDRISISNFGITEENMLLLGIDGVASKSEADNLRIYFNNTELANILTAINISNFSGSINGGINIRQALETPMISTDELRIENITVHNDTIGTLIIEGDWDQTYSGLNLAANLINEGERSLEIKGYIPTGDESPLPMDVTVLTEDFELYALQPLTVSALSQLSGRVNSNIKITGKPSEPLTEGWLGIEDGIIKVAYTNVTYYLSDTIQIKSDNVGLENLVIRDQNNNTATLNLSLSHTNFGRMVYTAGITLNDFMLLNNKNRTDLMVYGDLRLSGNLSVTGSPMGIYGDGKLTTRSASEVTVMLPQTAQAAEYSGVIYINTHQADSLAFLRRRDEELNLTNSRVNKAIPIVMRATVDLNPLLEASVLLDPTTGNAIEVSGDGEININFNSKSTPPVRLYGDYVINSGKFHYNLQNLRTVDFNIREGSRLTMEGNPLNTQFNIIAYLPVRADLAALSPTFATELANTRVPVNALLQIRGNLEGMDLQYDIELPESSNDIQQRVNSFISDEDTKILQFAYLATTGSFIPSQGSPDLNFGPSVFTKFAASTLSRGLDALFSSALNDNWSVSTNLESVDGTLDNVRMGLDVSTRLLNNRLRITTNLSYGDNSMMASQQAFMGEFDMEYDINNWLMLRAFNRANERFYSRTPTTQGVGVVVTKEAQSLRDLFNFRFIRPKDEDE
ncbi:MAG: translocation/assembly module TamB domain-containing protein [Fermentimonas sp.]